MEVNIFDEAEHSTLGKPSWSPSSSQNGKEFEPTTEKVTSKNMSLEAMLDEERREVLALLETTPEARAESPVRSMLDIGDDPSIGRFRSAGESSSRRRYRRLEPVQSMLDITPPTSPAPVRSMLDINFNESPHPTDPVGRAERDRELKELQTKRAKMVEREIRLRNELAMEQRRRMEERDREMREGMVEEEEVAMNQRRVERQMPKTWFTTGPGGRGHRVLDDDDDDDDTYRDKGPQKAASGSKTQPTSRIEPLTRYVDEDSNNISYDDPQSESRIMIQMVSIPWDYEKAGLYGIVKWAFPTICLNIAIRRDPKGEEFLLQRVVMNECLHGRFDMEVKIIDTKGWLVATSTQSCLMLPKGQRQKSGKLGSARL
ncbi:hypothetical protein EG329_008823 [Mollisiaceae sp. DMI_Dod_QoI]|nr:hypothetical protein EG329_008823 [Helotiales sp. DMI_Dod_QoI]